MSTLGEFLLPFWSQLAAHLWQSTLVLAPLFLLAHGLRRAPAQLSDWFWSLALLKLFLPLAVCGAVVRHFLNVFAEVPVIDTTASNPVVTAVTTMLDSPPSLGLTGAPGQPWLISFLICLTVLLQVRVIWFLVAALRDRAEVCKLDLMPLDRISPDEQQRMQLVLGRAAVSPRVMTFTTEAMMPAVIGLWRPRIAVPQRLIAALSDDELIAVLKHEETHRRRREPLRALLQRFCQSLFFFYPLVYPILRRLRENAEFACDEAALATGIGARSYARALARSVSLALVPLPLTVAAGTGGPSLLHKRLRRLDQPERKTMSRYRLIIVAAALLVAAGSFLPLASGADSSPEPVDTSAPVALPENVATPETVATTAPVASPETVAVPEIVARPEAMTTSESVATPESVAAPEPMIAPAPLAAPGRVAVSESVALPIATVESAPTVEPVLGAQTESAAASAALPADDPPPPPPKKVKRISSAEKITSKDAPKKPARAKVVRADGKEHVFVELQLVHFEQPEYPKSARKDRVEGTVHVLVVVNEKGEVIKTEIKKMEDGSEVLQNAALVAAGKCLFKPATRDGEPVQSKTVIPFKFRVE